MSDTNYKIVEFVEFCPKCKYEKLTEEQEPCATCLNNPVNESSHKPTEFVEKEG